MVKEVVIADEMIDYAVDLVRQLMTKAVLRMNGRNMSNMAVVHGDFSPSSDWQKRVHLWQDVFMYRLRILKLLPNLHYATVF